jgi:hypothetical protein
MLQPGSLFELVLKHFEMHPRQGHGAQVVAILKTSKLVVPWSGYDGGCRRQIADGSIRRLLLQNC